LGRKATEALVMSFEELTNYLYAHHSVYLEVDGLSFYITDVNDNYWRAQDTSKLNEKGHYVDASDLVPTLTEFLGLPFVNGERLEEVFDRAVFYASEK